MAWKDRGATGSRYQQSFKHGLFDKYAKVAGLLPPGCTILEIGCHTGDFGNALIELGYQVNGIDNDPEAAAIARSRGIPTVCGDIEDTGICAAITGKFDRILLMDVLEHLRYPEKALESVKGMLNVGGRIIVTGPNVANWTVRKGLAMGNWEYADGGILDRTHLHFYTRDTWRDLIANAGYRVLRLESASGGIPLVHHLSKLFLIGSLVPNLHRAGIALLPRLFTVTFLIEAQPIE